MTHRGRPLLVILCLIACSFCLLWGNEGIAQTSSVPTPTDGVLPTPSRTPLVDYYVDINAGLGGTVDGVRGHTSYFAYPGISFFNISIVPDPGYKVLDVTDNGVSLGAIKAYDLLDVQTNHVINATFTIDTALITPSPSPTPTVPEIPWLAVSLIILTIPIFLIIIKKTVFANVCEILL
jgi:hypothetical protein